MNATLRAAGAAVVLVVGAGAAKLAHLGPFADEAFRLADTTAMSSIAFRENYAAMRAGTFAEQQAVDIACTLFSSLAVTGDPPENWSSFPDALADRMGVTDSSEYIDGKIERLAAAAELAERNPRVAAEYARHCLG